MLHVSVVIDKTWLL